MVRRRKSRSKDLRTGPRPFDKRDGKIKRWNTLEDIPMDEEDQCALAFCPHGLPNVKPCLVHASKDRILLEGEGTGADDDGDEEEVFALKGIPSSESDEDEEDVYEEGDDDEDQPHPPARVRKGGKAKAKPPPESDEEEEEQGNEEEEGWGHKKSAYYSSNAAELDSDDEEANELEEQEARRIQVKARDTMLDDDFGLADLDLDDAEETEECVYPSLEASLLTEISPVLSFNPRWWSRPRLHRLTRRPRSDTWKRQIPKPSHWHMIGRTLLLRSSVPKKKLRSALWV